MNCLIATSSKYIYFKANYGASRGWAIIMFTSRYSTLREVRSCTCKHRYVQFFTSRSAHLKILVST